MRRFSILLAIVASLTIAVPVLAANPPGQNKIICYADAAATAVQSGAQGCILDVDAGGAAFAYYSTGNGGTFPNAWDKRLGSITQLSFRYTGDLPYGGVPRFSIQIDPDGSGFLPPDDVNYVFIAAADCNNGAGLVDVINDATCTVYYGAQSFANWAAFVSAYPNATLYFAFVAVDQPWAGTISSLKIGKPGK